MGNQLKGNRLDVSCFTVDFWEDKVFVGGDCFPAGQFIVDLLNLSANTVLLTYLSVKNMAKVLKQLEQGFVYARDFNYAKEEFDDCLTLMKEIRPLSFLDMGYEKFRLAVMTQEKELEKLQRFFALRSKLAENCHQPSFDWYTPDKTEQSLLTDGEYMLKDMSRTLCFYIFLGTDIVRMREFVKEFIAELPSLGKLNESHLISKLTELCEFGYSELNIDEQERPSLRALRSGVEYVAIHHPKKKDVSITARRMIFTRFLDFLIADFFEGIHCGHYPRQCQVCGKYFLRQDARKQLYCDDFDPNDSKGRSCRMIAADRTRRERSLTLDHPIKSVCARRLSTINTHKNNGKISEEFAAAAKCYAQNCRDRALDDDNYALTQYKADMTPEAVYAFVRKQDMK